MNNLRQVNLAILLYSADHADALPVLPDPNPYPNGVGAFYKELVKGYAGLTGPSSPDEKVFQCPSDQVMKPQASHAFTSYTFNGYEVSPGELPRITGKRLDAIRHPSKAVLAGEWIAYSGGAWHPLTKANRPDARAVLSFADGHAAFTKIYWNGVLGSNPSDYEPPPGYSYSWDGE